MKYKQRPSGLCIPHTEPKPKPTPKPSYPALEIQDEELREKAKKGLSLLWDAMELSDSRSIFKDSKSSICYDYYKALYDMVGRAILGENDCPEKEVLC
jgi:hypothetical protein